MTDENLLPTAKGRIRRLTEEARRFGPAIGDQAVWSLAGFVSSALVARFLGAAGLGLFAIGTALVFGLGGVLNSIVLDPASIIGQRHHGHDLRLYGGMVFAAAVMMSAVPTSVGLGVVSLVPGDLASVIGIALVMTLPVFSSWAARRLPYLSDQQSMALSGSVVYVVVVTGSILVAQKLSILSVGVALAALGVGSASQAGLLLRRWRPSFSSVLVRGQWRGLVGDHWNLGRWFLATEASSWILNYGLPVATAAVIDLVSAGAFRAGQALIRPYGIVFVGTGMAYLPRLSRVVQEDGPEAAHLLVRRIGWVLSAVAALVASTLLLLGGPIMGLAFGPEFSSYGWLVAALAATMIPHGWIVAFSLGLQSSNQPKDAFYGQAASAITALVASPLLGTIWGLAGFVGAFALATAARFVVVLIRYRRLGASA